MPPISALADYLLSVARNLNQTAEDLRIGANKEGTIATRMALIRVGTELIDHVARPEDKLMVWLPVLAHLTAIRLFIKWGAFEKIPTTEGASTTLRELAGEVEGDVGLVCKCGSGGWVLGCGADDCGVSSRWEGPRGEWYPGKDGGWPYCPHGVF